MLLRPSLHVRSVPPTTRSACIPKKVCSGIWGGRGRGQSGLSAAPMPVGPGRVTGAPVRAARAEDALLAGVHAGRLLTARQSPGCKRWPASFAEARWRSSTTGRRSSAPATRARMRVVGHASVRSARLFRKSAEGA